MTTTYATVDPEFYAEIEKGTQIEIRTNKGNVDTGTFVSVNSKGINFRNDAGRVVARSLSSVAQLAVVHPDGAADLFEDGETYTASQLAAIFDTSARALRVQLRQLGVGVGKGHRYELSANEARKLHKVLTATDN